jgi:hypothetical protein
MLNNHRTVKSATRRLHTPISMGEAPVDGLPLNIFPAALARDVLGEWERGER